jgi:hypothetical protein
MSQCLLLDFYRDISEKCSLYEEKGQVSVNIEGALFQALQDLLSPHNLHVLWVVVPALFNFPIYIKYCR